MKVLGVLSILFGVGLIWIAIYGTSVEIERGRFLQDLGSLIALALFIAGAAIIWFSGRTFMITSVETSELTVDILDIPDDHISKKNAITPFTRACGFVSLFASTLLLLFVTYNFYNPLRRLILRGRWHSDDAIVLSLIFGCVIAIIYCLRKLVFYKRT
jgi:hypothetical protein